MNKNYWAYKGLILAVIVLLLIGTSATNMCVTREQKTFENLIYSFPRTSFTRKNIMF